MKVDVEAATLSTQPRPLGVFFSISNKPHITVILTTHDMDDIDQICRRVITIEKGERSSTVRLISLSIPIVWVIG